VWDIAAIFVNNPVKGIELILILIAALLLACGIFTLSQKLEIKFKRKYSKR